VTFRTSGTAIVLPVDARCLRCNGAEHLVVGDGPVVCRPCIDLLGGIARDPLKAPARYLELLAELHGEVVALTVARPDDAVLAWEWIAGWPPAADGRLLSGGTA
jgi:hypothetical protein